MRPIKLTLTAFGPYRDKEVIDFTKLGDHRLFVISGNTGAGKTTLFDGICYALYGSASGEDRAAEIRNLRSHFADDSVHTSVELVFAIREKQYRVFRQMKHRKGNNKSETGEKNELYEITELGEVPAVDRFLSGDVNKRINEIIGLTKEQFSQIVMLPQGEFRKLLTSSTDDKEKIMRKIFRTERFERLEQLIGQQTKQLQEKLRNELQAQKLLLHQIAGQLPLREGSELAEVYAQETQNSYQVSQALEKELTYYTNEQQKLEGAKIELAERLSNARKAVLDGEEQNRKLAELKAKQSELEQLQQQAEEIKQMEDRLNLAEKARYVEPLQQRYIRAKRQLNDSSEQLQQLNQQQQQLVIELERAKQQWDKQQALEPERSKLQLELHELESLLPLVKQLEQEQKELTKAEQLEKQLTQSLEQSEHLLQEARLRRGQLQQQLESNQQLAIAQTEQQTKLKQIEKLGSEVTALYKEVGEILALSEQLHTAEQKQHVAAERLNELEKRWLEGQAGELALHLHDGQPCPVCGSNNHPHKARPLEQMPSKEELEQARAEQLKALGEYARIVEGRKAKLERLLMQLNQLEVIPDDEGEDITWSSYSEVAVSSIQQPQLSAIGLELERAQALLRQQWRKAKEQLQTLQKELEQLERAKEEQQQLELRIESLEAQLKQQQQSQQQALVSQAALRSTVASLTSRIPLALQDEQVLQNKLKEVKAIVEQMQLDWKAASEHYQNVTKQHMAITTQVEAQQKHYEQAVQELDESKLSYLEQLTAAGFMQESDYLSAKLSEEQATDYRTRIETFKERVVRLRSELELLQQAVKGMDSIDLEPLREKLAALQDEFEQFISRETEQRHYISEITRFIEQIKKTSSGLSQLEGELAQLTDIFSTMRGDNPLKLSFERYILIDYLEQILMMANLRLSKLSNGQFELRRSDRLETNGKQSGLGLDVYDAYTGQNRDVKTLSGGEKFNAALCLALGMSDVIQAQQGGVSIEMMFIDEGFGSLDEESLEKAIATLIDLQRSGRMIGIISHVQDIKAALPACLEVCKSREGHSYTSFVIR